MKFLLGTLCLLAFYPGLVFAEPSCTPTPSVAAGNYPGAGAIPSSNNLLKPTGKANEVEAQRLIIHGRLVDAHCKPVPAAVVELWQVDPFGKWFLAEAEDIVSPNPAFAGAGRAITDQEGYFSFITAFPGVYSTKFVAPRKLSGKKGKYPPAERIVRAPHINIKIKAEGFKEFSSAFFFADDRRNKEDGAYKKLTPQRQSLLTMGMEPQADGSVIGSLTVTLAGDAPFRTY